MTIEERINQANEKVMELSQCKSVLDGCKAGYRSGSRHEEEPYSSSGTTLTRTT